jgi:hypothetical protein
MKSSRKYKCIIFDCDGARVDSEPIANTFLLTSQMIIEPIYVASGGPVKKIRFNLELTGLLLNY